MTARTGGSSGGFSLIEMVVSAALMLAVTAAVFTLTNPASGRFLVQLEAADMQQRLRVGADLLTNDLTMAGAGSYAGSQAGPLGYYLAPVLPYRRGTIGADPPGTFTSSTLTLLYVPATAAQTTIRTALGPGLLTLLVNAEHGCPQGQTLCGFTPGMTLLTYDGQGNFDTFTLSSAHGNVGQLRPNRPGGVLPLRYETGTKIVQAVQRTYSVKRDSRGVDQLVYSDGGLNADVAVVDHVAALEFDYYGDPQPPILRRPVTDPVGAWTTYGPKPPTIDLKPTAYPQGENCVFTIDPESGRHAPRLAVLGDDPIRRSWVRLTSEELGDGAVWCPDATAPDRFDADLLRIRKIAVTIRFQSALDALRGPAGPLFTHGGTARDASRMLPDRELRFQLTPPNLNPEP